MINHNNRLPTRPGRRLITPEDGNDPFYATLAFADEPTDEGALVNKALLDEFLGASGVTTGTENALLLAQDGYVLKDGVPVLACVHLAIDGAVTLNVASTGEKPILAVGGQVRQTFAAGAYVSLVYSAMADAYIAQATAQPRRADLGIGKTLWTGVLAAGSSIDLPAMANYNFFFVRTNASNIMAPCYKYGASLYGMGGRKFGANNFQLTATVDATWTQESNKLTLNQIALLQHTTSANHNAMVTTGAITAIFGIC